MFYKKKYPNQLDEQKLLKSSGKLFCEKDRKNAVNKAINENFNVAIYLWIFFFIIPLMLVALGNDYIKNRISDFKSLKQSTRWPLYILLFGVWDLMIGFAYLMFSYLEVTQITMIVANALFITGTYLTFLSFSVAKKLQLSRKD